eukprot:TRINITY_DN15768_c0_g1_i1.p2 TRINITY_DN15768_c0_g1~~TRINITY_DN15768_c0_g1_i1.p2  ORF type:complete len:114 (-),score=32.36 TRINITY_DN15768_c0_g1_i1:7-348(-)
MGVGSSSAQAEVQQLLRDITFDNQAATIARLKELKAAGAEGSGEMKYAVMKRAASLERDNRMIYEDLIAAGDITGAARVKGEREALLDAAEVFWPGEFRKTELGQDSSVCIIS